MRVPDEFSDMDSVSFSNTVMDSVPHIYIVVYSDPDAFVYLYTHLYIYNYCHSKHNPYLQIYIQYRKHLLWNIEQRYCGCFQPAWHRELYPHIYQDLYSVAYRHKDCHAYFHIFTYRKPYRSSECRGMG